MTFHIGLAAWIIQDGNYEDFEVGREYRFALEFYPHDVVVAPDASSIPRLAHVGNARHDAVGTIVFCSDAAWVVDFGVLAFQEAKPPSWAKPGTVVSGRFYLGVAPFFYFERLKEVRGMPDLFRQWFIRRILLETTPWKEESDPHGRKFRTRDSSRESFIEVPATDAWKHDGGSGHYVLECEQRMGPGGSG
ncbi:MAG: hypothetical protein HZA52_04820 [Planctomycetes bacterium]|nr:hypothetical protein [Planctomycetota bacterium]